MNLPIVDANEEVLKQVHPIDNLDPTQKKGVRPWKSSYQLISFSTPTPVISPSIKKKFRIQFSYLDKSTGKVHSHVVHFGTESDYIYTKDKKLRIKKLTTMKNLDNPFRGNYWSAWLMNKYNTMQEGFNQLQKIVMKQNHQVRAQTQALGNLYKKNKRMLQLKPLDL